jgi:YjjG family noncanonical pyrimidine nucleotidase
MWAEYELVFIDADDTLFDFRRCEEEALGATLLAAGFPCDDRIQALYRGINARAWAEVEAGTLGREELKTRRFAELFAALGLDADAGSIGESYLDHLSCQAWLLDGAVEICAWLRERAVLVLLTNGIARVQRGRLARSALADAFDHVVISEEVGLSKPDPRIFAHGARLAGKDDRRRMIMIGDSLSSDMAGGRAYGIATCWYNPWGAAPGEIRPDHVIRSLRDLTALLY